jgi:serine/threonine-protein kinase
MCIFDSIKETLTNFSQIKRGGQKVVFSAIHPKYGDIVIKLCFNIDVRSQREISIGENYIFDCVPTIYETGHVVYEGAETLYIIEQRINGIELR